MIYQVKEGSEAYEYIKSVYLAEKKEKEAYFRRVEKKLGFEIEQYSGYQPNRCLLRKYEITALLLDDEHWGKMDKSVWREKGMVQGYHQVVPHRRTKAGKEIDKLFCSCGIVTTHFKIIEALGITPPDESSLSITQLLYDDKGHYFIYFDDSVRADKQNDGLVEITRGQFEDIMNGEG